MSTWTRIDGIPWEMRADGSRRPVGEAHPRLLAYLQEHNLTIGELPVMPEELRPFMPAVLPVPIMQRQRAYIGNPLIDIGVSENVTCDAALLVILAYQLEGDNEEADRIKALWLAAKATIRAEFPD